MSAAAPTPPPEQASRPGRHAAPSAPEAGTTTQPASAPAAATATQVAGTEQPAQPGQPVVEVLGGFSAGRVSGPRLVSLAAIAPAGASDPLDTALAGYLTETHSDLPQVTARTVEDAERGEVQLTHATYPWPGKGEAPDEVEDVVVMRGPLEDVLRQAKVTREERSLLRTNAQMVEMRGCQALGIAVSRPGEDGAMQPFRVEGFVTVRRLDVAGFEDEAVARPGDWVRVNLWSAGLRIQHWLNVFLIFVLSCTGYYIMDPFIGPIARAGVDTGFIMGWVRFIHFTAAFAWVATGLTRLILLFTARDRFLRWPTLWPLKSMEDVRNLGRTAAYYLFLRKHAPLYVAHNPLQQLTYTGIYVAAALQIATGSVLYAQYHRAGSWFWNLIGTPADWVGIPFVRLVHTLLMFGFWAFVIAHVYLAVRADSVERHGGVSSMLNGGVWLKRGSRPVDAPPID